MAATVPSSSRSIRRILISVIEPWRLVLSQTLISLANVLMRHLLHVTRLTDFIQQDLVNAKWYAVPQRLGSGSEHDGLLCVLVGQRYFTLHVRKFGYTDRATARGGIDLGHWILQQDRACQRQRIVLRLASAS